jgi:hypothetical protein
MSKIMNVQGKVSDMFSFSIYDSDTSLYIVPDYEGYVPQGSGVGRGDYIEFSVDIETGLICRWKNPLKNEAFCTQLDLELEV